MKYFYHLVPNPFIGKKLIPLNEMDPKGELFLSHSKKYIGRESLTKEIIPILNCKWNDVVQFSAINPQLIINQLRKIQPNLDITRMKCFKVCIEEVEDIYEGVIFEREQSREKGNFKIYPSEVKLLNSKNYKELSSVPEKTIEYWKRVESEGGKYLWFPYIPHVFLKGAVDTTHFEVIDLV